MTLETNLESHLNTNKEFKLETSSVVSIQVGSNYGFVIPITSQIGKYYCPVQAYTTKEQALRMLRSQLK